MRRIPDIVTLAAILTFVVAGGFFFRFTADDAFIPARHGANLIDHGTLVFNVGDRVSALTSPLQGLVCAALYAVAGEHTIVAWKWLAALLVLAGVALPVTILAQDPWRRATVAAFLLASSAVILWTWGGLETPLAVFLVAAIATVAMRPLTADRLTILFVLSGLAFLTRYDTVIFTVPVCAHAVLRLRNVSATAFAVLVGAAAPAAWLLAANRFYGDIWPTSFYIKAPQFAAAGRNGVYLGQWLLVSGAIPLGALALLPPKKRARARGIERPAVGLSIGVLAMLGYGLGVATHHMMFSFRYFVPYLPVVALLAAVGVERVVQRSGERVGAAILVGFLATQCLQVYVTYTRSMNGVVAVGEYRAAGAASYTDGFLRAMSTAGREVREHWARTGKARAPRVDTFAAGALPWECRNAYVFEPLASYRHGCVLQLGPYWKLMGRPRTSEDGTPLPHRVIDLMGASDYVHVLTPRHGPVERHLVKPVDQYELVSSHEIVFDGQPEQMLVFFDPTPTLARLPVTLGGD